MSRNSGAPRMGIESALATRPRVPAVNLIPRSVLERRAGRAGRIAAIAVGLIVIGAIGAGAAGVAIWRGLAGSRLADAKAESVELAEQRKQYQEIIDINSRLARTDAALVVAMGYEVDWAELLRSILESKPDNSALVSIDAGSITADEILSTSTNVLNQPSIGMITVILDAMGLPAVADWVDTMDAMPALQDSSYRQVQDSPRSARYAYEATCVAIVNLAGLTGEQLGEDFIEWRTQYEEGDDPSNEGDAPSDEGTE